jgi:hypothetical protein
VAVAREHLSSIEVGEATQLLQLDELGHPPQRRELLLDERVGKLGEWRRPQLFDLLADETEEI